MKKIISTIITIGILFSGSYAFSVKAADGMEELKTTEYEPEGTFFSREYILEFMGHPNWMDDCYELDLSYKACSGRSIRDECVRACIKEANDWEKWYEQNIESTE